MNEHASVEEYEHEHAEMVDVAEDADHHEVGKLGHKLYQVMNISDSYRMKRVPLDFSAQYKLV